MRPVSAELPANPAGWPIRLVELRTPAGPALRRMALDDEPLTVPLTHRSRFLEQYLPQLRRIAEVVSSDSSFVPPRVVGPALELRVEFHTEHRVRLLWSWLYEIDSLPRRFTLGAAQESVTALRDVRAEQALRARLDPGLCLLYTSPSPRDS